MTCQEMRLEGLLPGSGVGLHLAKGCVGGGRTGRKAKDDGSITCLCDWDMVELLTELEAD